MLSFQIQLLRALTDKDQPNALTIISRGLGLRRIISGLLKVFDTKENLVVLVNATDDEERGIGEEMGMKLKAIGYEMPSKDRKEVYLQGGIVSVTSRILVVDMLNQIIPTSHITGLVVLQAENVTPTSTDAFIIRLYREHNTTGFIKAFSDQPEAFNHGLFPLQDVMTQLKVRHVNIWPRFHVEVDKALEKRTADVIELFPPLSEAMEDMHNAILECMQATLAEIRRACAVWIDVDDLDGDDALFKSFDRIIRSRLDPNWHKISPRTKQLVSDLTTLRQLSFYLFSMDCVAFNQYLETVISTNGIGAGKQEKSPWLFSPAAEKLIQTARKRVYLKKSEIPQPPTASTSNADPDADDQYWKSFMPSAEEEAAFDEMMLQHEGVVLDPSANKKGKEREKEKNWWEKMDICPVLEEPPKWSVLGDVLDEIEVDLHWNPSPPDASMTDCVLIMCNSAAACTTLRYYLSNDPEPDPGNPEAPYIRSARPLLLRRLKNYFFWKSTYGKMSKLLKGSPHKIQEASAMLGEESAALKRKREYKKTQPAYKRRRERGGASSTATSRSNGKQSAGDATEADFFEREAGEVASNMDSNHIVKEEEDLPEGLQDTMPEDLDESVFEEYFGLVPNKELIVIRSYSGDDDDKLLEELRPKYIVMYDPDPSFIRRVEAYKNLHSGLAMRVYFLMYERSVEEQRFLTTLRREKEAFQSIIRERQNMVITLEAERRPGERAMEEDLRTVSSRKAGGGKEIRTDEPTILVDVREFRSSLPGLLHQANLRIEPLTLSIGDYILSPDMCVERKAIPDLIQSFNSGRLYQQCELMSIYYRQPILLIEFDQKKSFSLQTYTETKGPNVASDTDLHSKLVLLTLTFPKLRIIWSSSSYSTADIFKELKSGQQEPESQRAAALGAEDQFGNPVNAEGVTDNSINLVAQEVLRSLPGITSKNFRYVMRKTENLETLLSKMSVEQLGELIGLEAARQLLNFASQNSIGGI